MDLILHIFSIYINKLRSLNLFDKLKNETPILLNKLFSLYKQKFMDNQSI